MAPKLVLPGYSKLKTWVVNNKKPNLSNRPVAENDTTCTIPHKKNKTTKSSNGANTTTAKSSSSSSMSSSSNRRVVMKAADGSSSTTICTSSSSGYLSSSSESFRVTHRGNNEGSSSVFFLPEEAGEETDHTSVSTSFDSVVTPPYYMYNRSPTLTKTNKSTTVKKTSLHRHASGDNGGSLRLLNHPPTPTPTVYDQRRICIDHTHTSTSNIRPTLCHDKSSSFRLRKRNRALSDRDFERLLLISHGWTYDPSKDNDDNKQDMTEKTHNSRRKNRALTATDFDRFIFQPTTSQARLGTSSLRKTSWNTRGRNIVVPITEVVGGGGGGGYYGYGVTSNPPPLKSILHRSRSIPATTTTMAAVDVRSSTCSPATHQPDYYDSSSYPSDAELERLEDKHPLYRNKDHHHSQYHKVCVQ